MKASKITKIAFKLDAMLSSGFGKALQEADNKFAQLGDRMTSIGTGLSLGVTAPLVAAGAAAVHVGADFENSLSNIQARTGMAADEVEELGASVRELAMQHEHGAFTAREIAGAYGSVAVAGQDVEHATELMRNSMVLATATGNDLSNTAYFLGNYLLKIGKDSSYSERYINLFSQGIANTGMSLSDMQNYIFRMTPAFEQMGSSAETNVGIMTRLYQVGVRGANLYSGMGTIMTDFALGGDIASAATERFGVSTHDANGRLRSSEEIMFDVAIAMRDYGDQAEVGRFKLENLNNAQQAAWFEFMRNAEVIQNEVVPGFYEATSAAEGTGRAFEMAATQQDGMRGSAASVRASLEELSLIVSDTLMPHVQRLIDVVGNVIRWFANLDEGTQQNIIRFAMFAAAVGPVLVVLGKVVKAVGAAKAIYTSFKATLTAAKTVTGLMAKAEQAKAAATVTSTKATEAAKVAAQARTVANAAEKTALKLTAQADAMKAVAGANSAKATALAEKAEIARKTATTLSAAATEKAVIAEKARTVANKVGAAAIKHDTAAKKANALATTTLGKATVLFTTKKAAATAGIAAFGASLTGLTIKQKALAVATKAITGAKALLALGTKGLAVAFKIMSVAIMKFPVFGWILAAVAGVIAVVTVLVKWLNRVSAEYEALGEEADRLRERQEELTNAQAEQAAAFEDSMTSMANSQTHMRDLAGRIEYLSSKTELSAGEMERLQHYMAELGTAVPGLNMAFDAQAGSLNVAAEAMHTYLAAAQGREQMNAMLEESMRLEAELLDLQSGLIETANLRAEVEAKLNDGTRRRRRDTRALEETLAELQSTERAYHDAIANNRRMQEELANGIEVHAGVLQELEAAQEEARAAMEEATRAMEEQMQQAEAWEAAQSQALDRMNASFERYKSLTTNAFRTVTENVAVSVSEMTDNLLSNAAQVEEWSVNMALLTERGLDEGLIEQLRQAGPEAAATVRELVNASDTELEALNTAFEESTRVAMESMQRELDPMGVTNSAEELIDHVAETIMANEAMENALIDKVNASFDAMASAIGTAGFDDAAYEIPRGAAQAINDGEGMVVAAGERMINNTLAGMEAAARIASPSKETYEMFQFLMDGAVGGMYSKEGELKSAGEDMMHLVADSMYSKASVVEKACKNVSKLMAKNLHVDAPGFGDAAYEMPNNVIPFPGAYKAHSAQASFGKFTNLADDDDAPDFGNSPASTIRRFEDASNSYQEASYDFNYSPTITVNGGGEDSNKLKAMIKELLNEDRALFEEKVKRILEEENDRARRLKNA